MNIQVHMKSTKGPIDVRVLQDTNAGMSNLDFANNASSPVQTESCAGQVSCRSFVLCLKLHAEHQFDFHPCLLDRLHPALPPRP